MADGGRMGRQIWKTERSKMKWQQMTIFIGLRRMSGMADSIAMHKLLECAMSEEEARLVVELPVSTRELAAKFNMDEIAVEGKTIKPGAKGYCRA